MFFKLSTQKKEVEKDNKTNEIINEIKNLKDEINSLRILIDNPEAITTCLSQVYCEFEDRMKEIKKELILINNCLHPTHLESQSLT